jgi:hypothetical protein
MSTASKALLTRKPVNGWYLFWLVSAPMSVMMLIAMASVDLSTGEGVSAMIAYSVRWAVPFIFLVVAASSLQLLFPGPWSMWLLRNRKYIGLCFAVAMAWQGLFIFIMSTFFRDYYFEEIYLLRDELEGSIGYIFLPAMVLTSFRFGRRYLTPEQWRLLHKSGVYFLFAYPFSVYWWNLNYYGNPQPIDYMYYWGGFLAFATRIAAWGKKRRQRVTSTTVKGRGSLLIRVAGGAIVLFGMFAAATGWYWQAPVTALLTAPEWSANLELWLPFWPFEPFLPLFAIGLGTLLLTRSRTVDGHSRVTPVSISVGKR